MNESLSLKQHYVDSAPFDPGATEPMGAESESFYRASSWRLMWWKFRRHKVAVAAAFILLAFYAMVPVRGDDRALQPDQAPRRLSLRAAAIRAPHA